MATSRPLAEDVGGQVRRRVQAYAQVYSREHLTARVIAEHLDISLGEVEGSLAALVARGAVVPKTEGTSEPFYVPSARQKRLGEMLVDMELKPMAVRTTSASPRWGASFGERVTVLRWEETLPWPPRKK